MSETPSSDPHTPENQKKPVELVYRASSADHEIEFTRSMFNRIFNLACWILALTVLIGLIFAMFWAMILLISMWGFKYNS